MKSFNKFISIIIVSIMMICVFPGGSVVWAESSAGYTFSDYDTGTKPNMPGVINGMKTVVVVDYPDEKNKSLLIEPEPDGKEFWTQVDYPSDGQCVVEASFAYTGAIASSKRLFTLVSSNGGSLIFANIDTNGAVKMFDGRLLAQLKEGQFIDLALTLNFVDKTYCVKVNGKTILLDKSLPNTFKTDLTSVRIQMYNILSDTEKFYIQYFRIHSIDGGATVENTENVGTSKRPQKRPEIIITDARIAERMAGQVFLTTSSNRALVDNQNKILDADNPTLCAEVVDGSTMVPLRFIAEAFGAGVTYDEANSEAVITASGKEIKLRQNEKTYTVNGESQELITAAYSKDGRLMVPLRAISEILNQKVFYDECGYIIIGNNAENFNLSSEADKKILDRAVRNLIFDTPKAEEVISSLKAQNPDKAHPRLLVTRDSLPSLRAKVSEDLACKVWMENLLIQCDGYLDDPLLKYGVTDGVRMLTTSRTAANYIWNLSFAYLITQETKYAEGAARFMMNVCGDDFPDWHPYHFLDTAEMAAGVAIGYDWCYDYLSENQKEIIRTALTNKGLNEIIRDLNFEQGLSRSFYWNRANERAYPQNWVIVCSGGLSLAALAIGDESTQEGDLAGEVISKSLEHVKDLLAVFAPDGAWHEGTSYWRYSYQYFSLMFDAMQTALGTDYGLTKAPGLHKGAYFMIGMTGSSANFDLTSSEYSPITTPQLMWVSKQYKDPALAQYRTWFLEEYSQKAEWNDILWYQPEYAGGADSIPKETNTRGSLSVATSRSGYGEEELYIGFTAGDKGTGSHLHYGQFVLDLFGKRWAMDSGSEKATYFVNPGVGLHDYYRTRAEGHNTIVINPGRTEDMDIYATGTMERSEHNNESALMIADLTDAHKFKGAKSVKRGILLDKVNMTTTIQDEVELNMPSTLYWFMHTGGTIEVAPDGRSAVLVQEKNRMHLQLIGDETLKLGAMNAVALDTSPHPSGGTDDSKRWKLFIKAENIESTKFAVVISPLCGTETTVQKEGVLTTLSGWELKSETQRPTLTGITLDGKAIEGFLPEKKIYTLLYDPYAVGGEGTDVLSAKLGADGAGEISIEPVSADNNCARVSITKDGQSSYYFVNIKELATPADAAKNFPVIKSEFVGENAAHGLTRIKPVSLNAEHVPQPENAPKNTLDGNYQTRWASDLFMTEIDYDLGKTVELSHVGIALFIGNIRQTMFKIALSDDGENWRVIQDIKSSGITEEMEIYNIGNEKARYVRLIGYGNTQGSLWFNVAEVGFFKR